MLILYLTLLVLTFILTFREFMTSTILNTVLINNQFINSIFNSFNNVFQNIFKTNLIFENGQIDYLTLISILAMFSFGYFQPNEYLLVVGLTVLFEIIMIIFGTGRALSLCLISIMGYTLGFYFGKKRLQYRMIKLNRKNQYQIVSDRNEGLDK